MPIFRIASGTYSVQLVPGRHAGGRADTAGMASGAAQQLVRPKPGLPPYLTKYREVEAAADASATVTPAVIPVVAALPAPTILAAATVTPVAITVTSTLPSPTIDIVTLAPQIPISVTSNDGWDTAPLAGQNIATYVASDDDDYITVTV